jgi:hypothetical protein
MKCGTAALLLMTSAATITCVAADAQTYYMRFKLSQPVKSKNVAGSTQTEIVAAPVVTPTPPPAPTDPTDVSNPAPPTPEAQVGPSTEPGTKPVGYVSPTTQPKANQGCDGKSTAINGATAGAMGQNVSFWSLGYDGFFIRFSVWRIRNANTVPVTVQLSGGLFSAKTVTVGAMSDSIAFSLAIGWTGEHQLRLYRGGQWVLIDRKTPASISYQGC